MPQTIRVGTGLVVLALIAFTSCKSTPQADAGQALKIARMQLGEKIDVFPNSTGQYTLYVQQPQPTASTALKFVVIETASLKVVASQTFIPGYVKWVAEDALEVLSVPGTLKSNDDLSNYKKTLSIRAPN